MSRRVAFVSGAASAGMGRAIARRLSEDGFDLAILDLPRSREGLEETAELVKAAGQYSLSTKSMMRQSDV